MKHAILLVVVVLFASCRNEFDPRETLSSTEYQQLVIELAPYVMKKPDDTDFAGRFSPGKRPYYEKVIEATSGKLTFFEQKDSATLFFLEYRDLSSLYEHYRGMGGYFRRDANGRIQFLNILYHTPRLTRKEMDTRSRELFEEMSGRGNVTTFLGNGEYIHTPNQDFYYNTKENRWDYTPNSSWRFLQEEQQRYDSIK